MFQFHSDINQPNLALGGMKKYLIQWVENLLKNHRSVKTNVFATDSTKIYLVL